MTGFYPTNVQYRLESFTIDGNSVSKYARILVDAAEHVGLKSILDLDCKFRLDFRLPSEIHNGFSEYEYIALRGFGRLDALQSVSRELLLSGCSMQLGIRDKDMPNWFVPSHRSKIPYTLGFSLNSLIHSSLGMSLHHSTLDGVYLLGDSEIESTRYGGGPPEFAYTYGLKPAIRDYRLIKEIMNVLDADECWGSEDNEIDSQIGICENYVGCQMSFYFCKHGPQIVIAGLEDAVMPTMDMKDQGNLGGYNRTSALHRIVDLPWSEYWRLVESGKRVPQRLLTSEDRLMLHAERNKRLIAATEISRKWRLGQLNLNEGFRTLE